MDDQEFKVPSVQNQLGASQGYSKQKQNNNTAIVHCYSPSLKTKLHVMKHGGFQPCLAVEEPILQAHFI